MTAVIASRARDVSHYQGLVDWKRERDSNRVSWALCKATEGMTYTDPVFAGNYAGLKGAGLVRGGYHYADPGQAPEGQAQRLISVVKPRAGADLVCLDLEKAPAAMTQAELQAWRRRFSARIRALAPGVTYIIYVGGYAHNRSGAGIGPDECDAWMFPEYPGLNSWPPIFAPRLGVNTTGFALPIIWQFSYTVGGYDASVATVNAQQLAQLGTRGPGPTPHSKDEPVQTADFLKSLPQDIPAGVWTNVTWNVDGHGQYSPGIFASGGGHGQCSAGLHLSAPVNGQLRFVEVNPATYIVEAYRGVARPFTVAGGTVLDIDRTFATKKGQHFYLQILVDASVQVTGGNVTALQYEN